MYYTIYEILNKVNGKKYIGKHQTTNLNDSYMGSGKLLAQAIKKYGRDSFCKNILFVYNTEQEMNNKERELITEEIISSDMYYNLGLGGEGGPMFKGRKHTSETKAKIGAISSKSNSLTRERRSKAARKRIHTDETKQKIREAASRRKHSLESRKKIASSNRGRKHTEESKQKIRESRLRILGKL